MTGKLGRQLAAIAAREAEIQAFVPGTHDPDRVRRAAATAPSGLPLSGVTVGVKDIMNADGYPTGCGSAIPDEEFEGPEASAVTRLCEAGAVVMGKTQTTEFAAFHPCATRNPHNLAHTPGGSSSGSVAAIAAGFCDLAFGTQTGGSTIRPAAYCGIFGFKPTLGRVALDGVFPYSVSRDHIGLFALELDLIGRAMAALDDTWRDASEPGFRLAVLEGPYLDQADEPARAHFQATIEKLGDAGFKPRCVRLVEDALDQRAELTRLTNADAARAQARLFPMYRDRYSPRFLEALEEGRAVTDAELEDMRSLAARRQQDMAVLMEAEGIDAWLCPAATCTAPEGLSFTGDWAMNALWTYTGLPAISLPSGTGDGNLPYGLQVVARHGQDEELLQLARQISANLDKPEPIG
ncbi:MAG: amidase [Pseudomonadota bacterium]